MRGIPRTLLLFVATAAAELAGCNLPHLWLREGRSAWLLTLHPASSWRVYAAYGGVYLAMAVFWLWAVDGVGPGRRDLLGAAVTPLGMAIIVSGHRADGPAR